MSEDDTTQDKQDKPADPPTVHSSHKFRYLLPPGNNFQFVAKFRTWMIFSCIAMVATVGLLFVNKSRHGTFMNWTIDFKGGTEIIFAFKDKTSAKYVKPPAAKLRSALEKGGEDGFELSELGWENDQGDRVEGMIVRTPRFSALKPEVEAAALKRFYDTFDKKNGFVKTKGKGITHDEATPVFAGTDASLELKSWTKEEENQYLHADEGTGEFSEVFSMWGIDRQYQTLFEKTLDNTTVTTVQSYGVGAKAGDKLRDDAAKSIIYAIFLIMLYLAFRFDIRYAPGAAFATVHDAFMVVAVFAITWTEVSLTSVAGLLTVMGYSVNDTVIVFDRIRENQAKLKDKKIERIIDISINEMLVRTLLTSSTVFATTLIMNIFGTGLVKNFAFAMNVGVIVGTYSSFFLAAPIFLWISKKYYSGPAVVRRRAPIAAAAKVAKADDDADESGSPGNDAA
ncbi:MAG: protein translocase subunit SecF [Proteobacteria bacterium]|nr:protein translocase subunit SecF [Pseudomonadota bacterium]